MSRLLHYICVQEILKHLSGKKGRDCMPHFMALLNILNSTLNAFRSPVLKNSLTLLCNASPFWEAQIVSLRTNFGKFCHRGMHYLYANKHSFYAKKCFLYSPHKRKYLNHWCEKKLSRKHELIVYIYQENILCLIGKIIWVSYLILTLNGRCNGR